MICPWWARRGGELPADQAGDRLHRRVVERDARERPERGDARAVAVEALRLRADHRLVDPAGAALEDRPVAIDQEVVPDVVPAVGVPVVAAIPRTIPGESCGAYSIAPPCDARTPSARRRSRACRAAERCRAPAGAGDDRGRAGLRRPRPRAARRMRERANEARSPRAAPRRRSWNSSAVPVKTGRCRSRRRRGWRAAASSASSVMAVRARTWASAGSRAPSAGRSGRSARARRAPPSFASRRRRHGRRSRGWRARRAPRQRRRRRARGGAARRAQPRRHPGGRLAAGEAMRTVHQGFEHSMVRSERLGAVNGIFLPLTKMGMSFSKMPSRAPAIRSTSRAIAAGRGLRERRRRRLRRPRSSRRRPSSPTSRTTSRPAPSHLAAEAQHRPARVRGPPGRRQGARLGRHRAAVRRRGRRVAGQRARQRGGGRAGRRRRRCRRRHRGRRSALVAGPATGREGRGRDRRGVRRAGLPRTRPPTSSACRRSTRASSAASTAVPPAQRKLVTSHDALGYYARRYGIEVIGTVIPALTTAAQPSAGEVAKLVDTIKRHGRDDDLRRELGQPEGRGGDRPRGRRARSAGSCGRTRSAPRAPTARPTSSSIEANTRALVDGFTGGAVDCRVDA